jgi:N-acetylglutamate synthase-like GNAT family acetyltransferase
MLLTMQRWHSLQNLTRCKNDILGVNYAKTGLLRRHRPVTNGDYPKESCYQEVLCQHDHRYLAAPDQLGNKPAACCPLCINLHTMEIKIEPYTDQYKQQVLDLIVPIQREEFAIPITAAEQPDLQQIPAFYQKDNGNFWVAITDTGVVGTIALLDIGDHQGALRKMFVHKNYRGKEHGTGQLLLNTLLAWAQQKGYTEIYLGTTAKFLAAHRFYEKNNFTEVEITELPAAFPRMAVDVKFYRYGVGG